MLMNTSLYIHSFQCLFPFLFPQGWVNSINYVVLSQTLPKNSRACETWVGRMPHGIQIICYSARCIFLCIVNFLNVICIGRKEMNANGKRVCTARFSKTVQIWVLYALGVPSLPLLYNRCRTIMAIASYLHIM